MIFFESVSKLNSEIKTVLETNNRFSYFAINGEISNFKKHSSGHLYLSIKDNKSSISAMMFAGNTRKLLFNPKDGDKVVVTGKLAVYEPYGTYQIQIFDMALQGVGELYLQYEKLKKEYLEKGYFDDVHKKEIPLYPKTIGVITSPTGAVIEDITNTVNRRYPLAKIKLFPALVQGANSKESISSKIIEANTHDDIDILIVGRGGGSIEDLWAFNERVVIEAIFNSRIPIITAIGHQTDHTISDDVSDKRAPTPTAAAELATPDVINLRNIILEYEFNLKRRVSNFIDDHLINLNHLDHRIEQKSPINLLNNYIDTFDNLKYHLSKNYEDLISHKSNLLINNKNRLKNPYNLLIIKEERVNYLSQTVKSLTNSIVKTNESKFSILMNSLNNLNPLYLMDRGYSIPFDEKGNVASYVKIEVGDTLDIRFREGLVKTSVISKENINEKWIY